MNFSKLERMSKESEKDVEAYLIRQLEALGGLSRKWLCPQVRGTLDQICFLPNKHIFFVECKSEGKKPSKAQLRRAKELTQLGHQCYYADTKEAIANIIKGEIHDKATTKSPFDLHLRYRIGQD